MPQLKLLLAASATVASALTGSAAVPAPVAFRAAISARPILGRTSVIVAEEYPTLEEELSAGRITQAEYDELSGGISEEEYAAEVAQQQVELSSDAKKVLKNMRSETGVEFAPWMQVDAEAIAKAKKDREARKARLAASARSDSMLIDPQAAELGAGGGLKSNVLSEEEVELRWDTQDESGNAGFIVQRRRGGSSNFEDIESFESFAPLRTKGPAGGSYVYLDDQVGVGTWVYRILDCDTSGTRSGVCQKLVEIDSQSEQQQTLVVGAAIATLAVALLVAGIFADPIQTTQAGGKMF